MGQVKHRERSRIKEGKLSGENQGRKAMNYLLLPGETEEVRREWAETQEGGCLLFTEFQFLFYL